MFGRIRARYIVVGRLGLHNHESGIHRNVMLQNGEVVARNSTGNLFMTGFRKSGDTHCVSFYLFVMSNRR